MKFMKYTNNINVHRIRIERILYNYGIPDICKDI